MKDLERFKQCMESMGIHFTANEVDLTDGDSKAEHSVSTGQQHFGFDKDGRYVGMLSDDMGEWTPRGSSIPKSDDE